MWKSVLAILTVIALVIMAAPVAAQSTQSEQMVVNTTDLPPDLVAQLKTKEKMHRVSEYMTWADEVADATDKILGSVSKHATDFSQTDLGRFAMVLIAWKIAGKDILAMGNDFIGYLVGIPFLLFGYLVLIWSYRRQCVPCRVLVSVEPGPEGKGVVKKYDVYDPNTKRTGHGDWDKDTWAVFHVISFLIVSAIGLATMFA